MVGPSKHRLPATFRSLGTLRILNVVALASSLAAVVGTTFGAIFGSSSANSAMAATASSTFLVALVWAVVMRSRATVPNTRLRIGWIASIPLAALNGALSLALLMSAEKDGFARGFLLGGSFGAIFWVPGLLAVLALYGYPIAKAQSLAEKGLSGEERGERIVGIVSALIAAVAFVILPAVHEPSLSADDFTLLGRPIALIAIALGGTFGALAAVLATYRGRVRHAFVREVEAGAVEGFRVDATAAGKVLVRVTTQGGGYRAASFEEQVYGLDETGDAGRALSGDAS